MSEKLEFITIGYLFTFLNIFATMNSLLLWGIGFGIVGGIFFIRALRAK